MTEQEERLMLAYKIRISELEAQLEAVKAFARLMQELVEND